MSVQEELLALQQQADGLLQVESTVEWAAENPDSALHAALDWDDEHAAHSWRCHQVRRLIAIHVVDAGNVRQLVSLSIDRVGDGGYRSLGAVLASANMRGVLLADALADLDRVRRKYETLVELAGVWEETERASQKHRPKARKAKQA
jgi:hypothetical protein